LLSFVGLFYEAKNTINTSHLVFFADAVFILNKVSKFKNSILKTISGYAIMIIGRNRHLKLLQREGDMP